MKDIARILAAIGTLLAVKKLFAPSKMAPTKGALFILEIFVLTLLFLPYLLEELDHVLKTMAGQSQRRRPDWGKLFYILTAFGGSMAIFQMFQNAFR